MAVEVFLVNGTVDRHYQADAANLLGSVFVVSRWNTRRECLEDVRSYDAATVLVAEVYLGLQLTQRVLGSGMKPPESGDRERRH